MSALFDDPDRVIRLMVFHLRSAQANQGWVSWTILARQITGSDQYAEMLQGLAELPQYRDFFMPRYHHVKLSHEGHLFANGPGATAPAEPDDFGRRVGFAVRRYAAQLEPQVIAVESCLRHIAVAGGRIVHAFKVPCTDHYLASDTPVLYRAANRDFFARGRLVGQDIQNQAVFAALDREVTPADLPGRLHVDKSFLLTMLADRVEQLPAEPTRFRFERTNGAGLENANSVQLAAQLIQIESPWTKIIWGPPGGGKTHGIGYLVANLLRNDPTERILMVAPSNKAVDVAFLSVYRQCHSTNANWIEDRQFFRFGYPRDETLLERPELLGPKERDELSGEVRRKSNELAVAERQGEIPEQLAVFRAELLAAQERLKQAVAAHILKARVVATTTALTFAGLGDAKWSTVIVDEVTMVPSAVLVYLASLATKRFLLAGDPLQLGPVFENAGGLSDDFDRHWMGQDIFERTGIAIWDGHQAKINVEDNRLARIVKQRRCAPGLWAYVANLYPNVKSESVTEKRTQLLDFPPAPGEPVPILDVSNTTAVCKSANESWRNEETAQLSLEVARTAIAEAATPISVAIISPYRAQVRLLQSMLRDEKKGTVATQEKSRIEAGTVHQFQGSEADLVIFDLVDGPGRPSLGALLKGQAGMRLVNVAITRSKGKVIVIANPEWCSRVNVQEHNPLLHALIVARQPSCRIPVVAPDSVVDKTESPIEQDLLNAMLGIPELKDFALQHRILDGDGSVISRADFAFPTARLAIYCDGRQWHCVQNRWQRDLRQRNRLASVGWAFLAYSGRDIRDNAARCAQQVAQVYANRLAAGTD